MLMEDVHENAPGMSTMRNSHHISTMTNMSDFVDPVAREELVDTCKFDKVIALISVPGV